MKRTLIIVSLLATLLFSACDQRNTIDGYETNSTPDLSNPVIQKLTNVSWYKGGSLENRTIWTTTKFKDKASSPFESMLYSMAWIGTALPRYCSAHPLEKALTSFAKGSGKCLKPRRILLSSTRRFQWDIPILSLK